MRFWNKWFVIATVTLLGISGGALRADPPPDQNPVARLAGRLKPTGWDLPEFQVPHWNLPSFRSVLPGQQDHGRIIKKKDGLLSGVSQTAQKGWWKAKETLHPRNLHPDNLFAAPVSPPAARTASDERKEGSRGFFGTLFGPPEPAERVATMDDFMTQPRPRR